MKKEIKEYNDKQTSGDKEICNLLATIISKEMEAADNKIQYSHPVWFLVGNPIVGYSKQKAGIKLMFWSVADFEEEYLNAIGEKFKDAFIFYNNVSEIVIEDLKR